MVAYVGEQPGLQASSGFADWWVLEDKQNQIVGSIGSVPFTSNSMRRQLIAGTSSGWVAEERYRAYALLLLDRFLSQPDVDLHLCVSPNGEAQPAVALQCERVPVGAWDRAAFWITATGALSEALSRREVPFERSCATRSGPPWYSAMASDAMR